MYRWLFLAAAVSTACGEIECDETTFVCNEGGPEDNGSRPATLEYVTNTILRPNCAPAQCHSAFSYVYQYRFDTVEHARFSMLNTPNGPLVDTVGFDPNASLLFIVLIRETLSEPITLGDGTESYQPRMPYDQPLQVPDIALVKRWIEEGADGL